MNHLRFIFSKGIKKIKLPGMFFYKISCTTHTKIQHTFFCLFFVLFGKSQINNSFINHLSINELKREHFAHLEKITQYTTIDTSAFYKAKFFLQYKNPDFFLKEFLSSNLIFQQDTSAVNAASFLIMSSSEINRLKWVKNITINKESYYQHSIKNFYAAMANPCSKDSLFIPQKLTAEFYQYKKYFNRKPIAAAALSAVVPGLGKLFIGRKKSFATVFSSHLLFAVRTIESIKILGIKSPWTIFNLGFSGAFYFSNIYGTYKDAQKIKKERRTQLFLHASDYYTANCSCSEENKFFEKKENQKVSHGNALLILEEKIFSTTNEEEKNRLLILKMEKCIENYDFSDAALKEAKRVNQAIITDSLILKSFLWNAALLAHLNGNYYYANSFIDNYFLSSNDSSANAALLSVLIHSGTDTNRVAKEIIFLKSKDSSTSCLSCLDQLIKYERKAKKRFVIASRIIPGLGSIANGNILKGTVSLALTATIAAGIYTLVANNLYANAFLWGFPTAMKFYNGQIRLTKKLFDQKAFQKKNKLAAMCELDLSKILKKYPLNFK